MKTYLTGGAVRDLLMGIEPKDRDYVVIGSTPEEMFSLGFKQVGADFPVFLHPETGDEYALARIERKISAGYLGFAVDFSAEVKLADDLKRRDLTCNSMAMDEATGEIFDFFGGQEDIKNKILRHTSDAFAEDPVRILRIARFAARYGFTVHESTYQLMTQMVMNGEFDSLVPERVWAEFEKGLMEKAPWKMFATLNKCAALPRLRIYYHVDEDSFLSASDAKESLEIRCAAMFQHETKEIFDANRIPSHIAELALVSDKIQEFVELSANLKEDHLTLFHNVDIFRRWDRFEKALIVLTHRDVNVSDFLIRYAKQVMSVDCGAIALSCVDKKDIPVKIKAARIEAMK